MIGVADEATSERRLKPFSMLSTAHARLECKPNSGVCTGYYTPGSTPAAKVRLAMVVRNRRALRQPDDPYYASSLSLIFARIVVGVNQMVGLG